VFPAPLLPRHRAGGGLALRDPLPQPAEEYTARALVQALNAYRAATRAMCRTKTISSVMS